jgi:hypothetical protein
MMYALGMAVGLAIGLVTGYAMGKGYKPWSALTPKEKKISSSRSAWVLLCWP